MLYKIKLNVNIEMMYIKYRFINGIYICRNDFKKY